MAARKVNTTCTNCSNAKVRWSDVVSPTERKVKCPSCQEETVVDK